MKELPIEEINKAVNLEMVESILNGMDANICVTVPETGELLFLSEKLKRRHGIADGIKGKYCYEVLQGKKERCGYCPIYELNKNPEKTVVWIDYEQSYGRRYHKLGSIIDWPGGKKAHLEYGTDVTDLVSANEQLEIQKRMLTASNEIASRLFQTNNRDFDEQLISCLYLAGKCIDADRVLLFQKNESDAAPNVTGYSLRHQWRNPEIVEGNVEIGQISFSMEYWEPKLHEKEYMHEVHSDAEGERLAMMQRHCISSLLVIPMFVEGEYWGYISIDNCHEERIYTESEISILRSMGLMMMNAIARHKSEVERISLERFNRLMLDALPLACQISDEDMKILECNKASVELYGFKSKKEYIEKYNLLSSPEYQPDGQRSDEKRIACIRKAFETGRATYTWMNILPNGEQLPVEITLVRIYDGNRRLMLAMRRDLRRDILLEEEGKKVYYDSLTGIYNRRYFDEKISELLEKGSASKRTFSLMMVDVDHFKEYNSIYGHIEGDNILRVIANTIKSMATRENDFVARYGGEEFVVVLLDTDAVGARRVAEKMLQSARNLKITHEGSDISNWLTVSIGAVTAQLDGKHSVEDYVKKADELLYKSKHEGRDRYSFENLGTSLGTEYDLSERMRCCVVNDMEGFEVHYQPIVYTKTESWHALEALCRWNDPELGTVPPSKFIPVAENAGVIGTLGLWVLETAIKDCKKLGLDKLDVFMLSINISAKQLYDANFVNRVTEILKRNDYPTYKLCLEITESVQFNLEGSIIETLDQLHAKNINIALDDFGTGYSSLIKFTMPNIDAIKIERSFVEKLEADIKVEHMLKSLSEMAHSSGKVIVVEGIETSNQHKVLSEIGADFLQGYLFAKPMPFEALAKVVDKFSR